MKKRWLVLLIIFLAGLFFYFEHRHDQASATDSTPCPAYKITDEDLQATYRTYNITEFKGDLPPDVIIDFDEKNDENMATTSLLLSGAFRISFNRKYVVGVRTMNLTILHEMCHIKTFGDEHGPKWQACMLKLDAAGAFREIIIDGYEEPKFQVNGKEKR